MENKLTDREIKNLIKKIEQNKKSSKKETNDKTEMYKSQTDRNYKDGDRN